MGGSTRSRSNLKTIGKKHELSATSIRGKEEDEGSVEKGPKAVAASQPIRTGSADSQNDLPVREYTSKVTDVMFKTMLKNSEHLTNQKLDAILQTHRASRNNKTSEKLISQNKLNFEDRQKHMLDQYEKYQHIWNKNIEQIDLVR